MVKIMENPIFQMDYLGGGFNPLFLVQYPYTTGVIKLPQFFGGSKLMLKSPYA